MKGKLDVQLCLKVIRARGVIRVIKRALGVIVGQIRRVAEIDRCEAAVRRG